MLSLLLSLACPALSPPVSACPPRPRSLSTAGAEVRWSISGGLLQASVQTPPAGWVALALYDAPPSEGGALVILDALDDAAPPATHLRAPAGPLGPALPGAVLANSADRSPSGAVVSFALHLPRGPNAPALGTGRDAWLSVAWGEGSAPDAAFEQAIRVEL